MYTVKLPIELLFLSNHSIGNKNYGIIPNISIKNIFSTTRQ